MGTRKRWRAKYRRGRRVRGNAPEPKPLYRRPSPPTHARAHEQARLHEMKPPRAMTMASNDGGYEAMTTRERTFCGRSLERGTCSEEVCRRLGFVRGDPCFNVCWCLAMGAATFNCIAFMLWLWGFSWWGV